MSGKHINIQRDAITGDNAERCGRDYLKNYVSTNGAAAQENKKKGKLLEK